MKNIVGLKDPRTGKFGWVGFSKFEPDEKFVKNRQLWPSSNNSASLSEWIYDLSLDSEYPEPILLERVPDHLAAQARAGWLVHVEQEHGYALIGAKPGENRRRNKPKLTILESNSPPRRPNRPIGSGRKTMHRLRALLGRSTG